VVVEIGVDARKVVAIAAGVPAAIEVATGAATEGRAVIAAWKARRKSISTS
jgi:hypothetical protein